MLRIFNAKSGTGIIRIYGVYSRTVILPGCVIGAVLSPISGRIMDRFGARIPILTGDMMIFASAVFFWIFAEKLTIETYIIFYLFFTIGQAFAVGRSNWHICSYYIGCIRTDKQSRESGGKHNLWNKKCLWSVSCTGSSYDRYFCNTY